MLLDLSVVHNRSSGQASKVLDSIVISILLSPAHLDVGRLALLVDPEPFARLASRYALSAGAVFVF